MEINHYLYCCNTETLRFFVAVVVVFFCVSFYVVECLASFSCIEVFWKKGALKILKINSKQLGSTKSLEKYRWGYISGKDESFQLVMSGFQRLCLHFNDFFHSSYQWLTPFFPPFIKTQCKHYFEIVFCVTFVFMIFCFSLVLRRQKCIFYFKNRKTIIQKKKKY